MPRSPRKGVVERRKSMKGGGEDSSPTKAGGDGQKGWGKSQKTGNAKKVAEMSVSKSRGTENVSNRVVKEKISHKHV